MKSKKFIVLYSMLIVLFVGIVGYTTLHQLSSISAQGVTLSKETSVQLSPSPSKANLPNKTKYKTPSMQNNSKYSKPTITITPTKPLTNILAEQSAPRNENARGGNTNISEEKSLSSIQPHPTYQITVDFPTPTVQQPEISSMPMPQQYNKPQLNTDIEVSGGYTQPVSKVGNTVTVKVCRTGETCL